MFYADEVKKDSKVWHSVIGAGLMGIGLMLASVGEASTTVPSPSLTEYGVFEAQSTPVRASVSSEYILGLVKKSGFDSAVIDHTRTAQTAQMLKTFPWVWNGRVEVLAVRTPVPPQERIDIGASLSGQNLLSPFAAVLADVCTLVSSQNLDPSGPSPAYAHYSSMMKRERSLGKKFESLTASEFERMVLVHESTHCRHTWGQLDFVHPQWNSQVNKTLAANVFNLKGGPAMPQEYEDQKPSTLYAEMLADAFAGVDMLEQYGAKVGAQKLRSLWHWRTDKKHEDHQIVLNDHNTQHVLDRLIKNAPQVLSLKKHLPAEDFELWLRALASESTVKTIQALDPEKLLPLLDSTVDPEGFKHELLAKAFETLWQKKEESPKGIHRRESNPNSSIKNFYLEHEKELLPQVERFIAAHNCQMNLVEGGRRMVCPGQEPRAFYSALKVQPFVEQYTQKLVDQENTRGLSNGMSLIKKSPQEYKDFYRTFVEISHPKNASLKEALHTQGAWSMYETALGGVDVKLAAIWGVWGQDDRGIAKSIKAKPPGVQELMKASLPEGSPSSRTNQGSIAPEDLGLGVVQKFREQRALMSGGSQVLRSDSAYKRSAAPK